MKTKLITHFLVAIICLATTSCNTFYGLGKDLQLLGKQMAKNGPSRTSGSASVNQAGVYPVPGQQDYDYGPADTPPPR
jgi:predicted small secreted protein